MRKYVIVLGIVMVTLLGCTNIENRVDVLESKFLEIDKRLNAIEARLTKLENSTLNEEWVKSKFETLESKISVLEESSIYLEEVTDETLSRIKLVEDLVYGEIPKFKYDRAEVSWKSSLIEDYARAYSYWWRGNYREAVEAFKSFVNKYDDKFLTLQAYLLISDSLIKLSRSDEACKFLDI
ncbi:MAG: tetratricopeptide repeat protein, partial [candidate division WOR-3 bacterium]